MSTLLFPPRNSRPAQCSPASVVYEGRFWHGKLEGEHTVFLARSKKKKPWSFGHFRLDRKLYRRGRSLRGKTGTDSAYLRCPKPTIHFQVMNPVASWICPWWYFDCGSLSPYAVMPTVRLCCSRCELLFLSRVYNVPVTETAPCSKDVDIHALPCMIILFGNCSLMGYHIFELTWVGIGFSLDAVLYDSHSVMSIWHLQSSWWSI